MYNQNFPSAFFITGTDTGIGKTAISAMLAQGLNATYWKPIQAGLDEETDIQFVQRTTNLPDSHFIAERFRLQTPMSPHAAAEIDDVSIQLDDFTLPEYGTKHLVVEGAGGLMVPINDEDMIIDLISYLSLPVVLVSRSTLGTLNHTFLSLEALRKRNIPILGVVLNGPKSESNRKAIEKYGEIRILAEIEPIDEINSESLQTNFDEHF
ncbi:MAG TPA: dethiobiotin synthase [Balneolaceae bacterium]